MKRYDRWVSWMNSMLTYDPCTKYVVEGTKVPGDDSNSSRNIWGGGKTLALKLAWIAQATERAARSGDQALLVFTDTDVVPFRPFSSLEVAHSITFMAEPKASGNGPVNTGFIVIKNARATNVRYFLHQCVRYSTKTANDQTVVNWLLGLAKQNRRLVGHQQADGSYLDNGLSLPAKPPYQFHQKLDWGVFPLNVISGIQHHIHPLQTVAYHAIFSGTDFQKTVHLMQAHESAGCQRPTEKRCPTRINQVELSPPPKGAPPTSGVCRRELAKRGLLWLREEPFVCNRSKIHTSSKELVIGPGLGDTGTRSLSAAVTKLGLRSCHAPSVVMEMLQHPTVRIHRDFTVFNVSDAWFDDPMAIIWRRLMCAFPNYRIAYSTRRPYKRDFYRDRMGGPGTVFPRNWCDLPFNDPQHRMLMMCLVYGERCANGMRCNAVFERTEAAVLAETPKDRLVVLNLSEGLSIVPLARLLGKPEPTWQFPHSRRFTCNRTISSRVRGAL